MRNSVKPPQRKAQGVREELNAIEIGFADETLKNVTREKISKHIKLNSREILPHCLAEEVRSARVGNSVCYEMQWSRDRRKCDHCGLERSDVAQPGQLPRRTLDINEKQASRTIRHQPLCCASVLRDVSKIAPPTFNSTTVCAARLASCTFSLSRERASEA